MLTISKNEISEFCQSSTAATELVVRVSDICFDIEKTKTDIFDIVQKTPPIFKDDQPYYAALGLQYLDESNPYYDSVSTIWYADENHKLIVNTGTTALWTKWNDLGNRLSYLKDPIYSLGMELYRTRILVAMPGHESVIHIDYDWRYHIPIATNSECYLEYGNGERVHLPADGSAYIVNAGFMHKFCNFGNSIRYHYCGILNIPNKGDGELDIGPLL